MTDHSATAAWAGRDPLRVKLLRLERGLNEVIRLCDEEGIDVRHVSQVAHYALTGDILTSQEGKP